MGLINLKCTNCGAVLQGESSKDAMVCPHCNSAFVVEKAITNYNNTYNVVNNINADVVKIMNKDVDAFIRRAYILLEDENFEEAQNIFLECLNSQPENWKCYLGLLLAKNKKKKVDELYLIGGIDKKNNFVPNYIAEQPEYKHIVNYCDEDCLAEINEQISKQKYRLAYELIRKVDSIKEYPLTDEYYHNFRINFLNNAIVLYDQIKTYNDSSKRLDLAVKSLHDIENTYKIEVEKENKSVSIFFVILMSTFTLIIVLFLCLC